ncbi:MAG TPA: amidohydrolase family protein [Alphaproteobacteria bacterium]|nr:amidohydrolase family protein [Alphaproteobacteria bacterium]
MTDDSHSNVSRRRILGSMAAAGAVGALGGLGIRPSFAQSAARRAANALPSQGEFIVKGAYVLTMDPKLGEIPGGDIHVRNGAIVAVGRNLAARGAQTIKADGMIALPGFIGTHWHMWGAVARNMAGPTKETGYFYLSRLLGKFFTPEDNARGVRLALAEGLNSGMTTFNNWSHNLLAPEYADAELAVHKEVGARARFSYGYSRKTAPNTTLPLDDVARVQKQYFNGSNTSSDGLLTLGIAARGPENNSIEICQKEWVFARARKLAITTHMGTSAERVKKREGIQTLAKADLLGPDVLLIHVTNNSPEDLKLLAQTKTPISMSPFTELRTGFGITPVGDFLKAGVPVSLSVDTTILSGNADMFAIMKAIENIEDGREKSEYAISPQRVLEMATIDGARALGIADRTGSLVPGKRADFSLVRTDTVNMIPFTVPVRMIVQAAQPSDVDAVIVDGRFLKRHGKLTTVDMGKLRRDADDTIARAREEASKPGAGEGIRGLFTAH